MEIKTITSKETLHIRHKVLWPNKDPNFCIVEGDSDALHFGVFIDDKIVCVASVFVEGTKARLRKFATLHEYQGYGAGTLMLNHLINELKRKDINHFWFDARETAIEFYKRLGFEASGDRFYKSEVAYYKMSLDL